VRFLTPADVADVLNVSLSQVMALLRSGELVGVKIGGRGQWRVESDRLEEYIARMYAETADYLAQHPMTHEEAERAAPAGEEGRA
jgi:excisionase family DNA binding protein